MLLNNKNPDLMKYAEFEEIAFTYQKITWTWKDGGITADDDWEAPRVYHRTDVRKDPGSFALSGSFSLWLG